MLETCWFERFLEDVVRSPDKVMLKMTVGRHCLVAHLTEESRAEIYLKVLHIFHCLGSPKSEFTGPWNRTLLSSAASTDAGGDTGDNFKYSGKCLVECTFIIQQMKLLQQYRLTPYYCWRRPPQLQNFCFGASGCRASCRIADESCEIISSDSASSDSSSEVQEMIPISLDSRSSILEGIGDDMDTADFEETKFIGVEW
eukprot:Gb_14477 [translate_table: standard]